MKDCIRNWLAEQFGADDALHADLYAQYREELNGGADALGAALEAGDAAAIGDRAHAMKGMALSMGDDETAALCLELQKAGRGGDLAACMRLAPEVVAAVRALERE